MIKTLTVSALTVVLAIALTACGGGDKKADTTPKTDTTTETKTDTDTKTPDADPKPPAASATEPTCENAVAHALGLMVKAGVVPEDKAEAAKGEAIAKCKKENPPKESLECALKATSPAELSACDPKKK